MRIITFLIMIFSLNLFSQVESPFKNPIAINGATVYKANKNGNLEIITFAYPYYDYTDDYNYQQYTGGDYGEYFFEDNIPFKLYDKPTTNTLFLDKSKQNSTNQLYYYTLYTNEYNKIQTNYHTYIVSNNLLLNIEKDDATNYSRYGEYFHPTDGVVPIAIFIDYDKYGKKYIQNLMNKDLRWYASRFFEGEYRCEETGSYLYIRRLNGRRFEIKFPSNIPSFYTSGYGEGVISAIFPENRQIYIEHFYDGLINNQILINILDYNTLIVFEVAGIGFKLNGIYTRLEN